MWKSAWPDDAPRPTDAVAQAAQAARRERGAKCIVEVCYWNESRGFVFVPSVA